MKLAKLTAISITVLFFGLCAYGNAADLTGIWDVKTDAPGQELKMDRLLITQEGDSFHYAGIKGSIRNDKYLILGPLPERTLVRGFWVQVDKINLSAVNDDKFTGKIYMSVYNFKDSTRKVYSTDANLTGNRVVDPPPLLTIIGKPEMWVEKGASFTDPGAMAFEETGNNISDKITADSTLDTSTPGTYTVTYNVVGSNNKPADEVSRTVHVVEPAPPVLTLKGDPMVNIQKGDRYVDSGARAINFLNEDITGQVEVKVNGEAADPNRIDTSKAGTDYDIIYMVKDDHGSAQAARTVTVQQREDEQSFFKYCFISHVMD
ncbi:MAG: DUF5011 domain-containing protein [Desulfobacterales bacterium]